jgi:hypothetical protein
MQWPLTSQSLGNVSQREQLVFFATVQTPRPYPTSSLPTQFLTLEYCVGLVKAINHWRNLALPRFEPRSPKWHTGALSTTPQAYSQIFIINLATILDCFKIFLFTYCYVGMYKKCSWRQHELICFRQSRYLRWRMKPATCAPTSRSWSTRWRPCTGWQSEIILIFHLKKVLTHVGKNFNICRRWCMSKLQFHETIFTYMRRCVFMFP